MGWFANRQAIVRLKLEQKIGPVLDQALWGGEVAQAGTSVLERTHMGWYFLFGALAAARQRMYWLALTDQRVILLRLPVVGPPMVEDAVRRSEARVVSYRQGALGDRLVLDVGGKRHRLAMNGRSREDARWIAAAIGSPRQ
jgi:hypothetical protein